MTPATAGFRHVRAGNDFALSDLKVEQTSGDAKQAVVKAQFKNFGEDETVIFTLDQAGDACRRKSRRGDGEAPPEGEALP